LLYSYHEETMDDFIGITVHAVESDDFDGWYTHAEVGDSEHSHEGEGEHEHN